MKKFTHLSIFLCGALLLQCLCVGALAAPLETVPVATTEEITPTMEVGAAAAAAKLPFGTVSVQNGCRSIEGMVPLGGSERRLDTAQSAFVFEVSTGTVVYAYNPDTKVSPGTLTKLIGALVVAESAELDEVVTCSEGIQSKVPGGAQIVKLKSGEQLTVGDLLHCLLLHSANDAAVALAEHVAGTRDAFVNLINAKAQQLGCTNTSFGNLSGLDTAVSYTTARDITRIMTEVYKNEELRTILGTTKYTVPATNMSEERDLVTTNYMIDQSIIPQFLDAKVKAGLASYSEKSFANLVCVSESKNMTIVSVVMGCMRVYEENGWTVKSYGNFNEMQELIAYTYDNYKVNRIMYDGQALNQFSVIDGESDVVGQPHVNYDSVLPADCKMDNIIMEYTVVGGSVTAPVKKDQMIATVAMKYRNSYIAEAEIFAMGDVVSASKNDVKIHVTAVPKDEGSGGILSFFGVVGVLALGGFGLYVASNAIRRVRRRAQIRRRRANRRRNY